MKITNFLIKFKDDFLFMKIINGHCNQMFINVYSCITKPYA